MNQTMFDIKTILETIEKALSNHEFLFFVFSIFFILKLYIFIALLLKLVTNKTFHKSNLFLMVVLIGTLSDDSAWIYKFLRYFFFPDSNYNLYLSYLRIAWGLVPIKYLALSLFLDSLIETKKLFRIKLILIPITFIFSLYFFASIFLNFGSIVTPNERILQKTIILIGLFPLLLSSFYFIFQQLQKNTLPRILTKQLKLLLIGVIAPYWLFNFLQIYPFDFSPGWVTNSYTFLSLSNLLSIVAVYYCSRRMMGLRFLNFRTHVQAKFNPDFVEKFKTVLRQLSQVTNGQELVHITNSFFKESFAIPINKTALYIRPISGYDTQIPDNKISQVVETFISTQDKRFANYMNTTSIYIYDEIAFDHFYEPTEQTTFLTHFLDLINADIFIPIFEKDKFIAYIIVDRLARPASLYSDVERDEMLLFSRYLSNIINLLQISDLDNLIHKEKELKEELYAKHQEITQYKESIRSFLRSSKQKAIGIIFYKHRKFIFANQAVNDLIKINPNTHEGHPIAKALKEIAQQVERFKSPQTVLTKDGFGNSLVLTAVSNIEQNTVIITITYPEIADVIKKQIDMLKDPSEWDYLLYLETTKPGQLINQLIPGSGEKLLQFKIELLKTALSKKATLLDIPDQDVVSMVELLHHVSLRETLHIVELTAPCTNLDTGIKLFGINPIFYKNQNEIPLLEKLDAAGTLYIKNIHFLDKESQEHLAEFIRYGFFRLLKSEHRVASDVRIIVSTNQKLAQLVQEERFSKALYQELKQTTLSMPSLLNLSETELDTLAQGFSEQAISNPMAKTLFEFTDRDKQRLMNLRPTSLVELKSYIQQLLIEKSKKQQIFHETIVSPAHDLTDPELMDIVRMGKHALKDQRVMTLLWQKFKNQNKIAAILGVNRSSVNRRCKMYHLE